MIRSIGATGTDPPFSRFLVVDATWLPRYWRCKDLDRLVAIHSTGLGAEATFIGQAMAERTV
jgi:hypothetical protein